MKHFVFLFEALFSASSLFSQEVFKLGTVKGKHVTYEVKDKILSRGAELSKYT